MTSVASNNVQLPRATDEQELAKAKSFLQSTSNSSSAVKTNLYDHISKIISQVLELKPKNGVDIFESISQQIKRATFNPESFNAPNHLKSVKSPSSELTTAQQQNKLFVRADAEGDVGGEIPDMLELSNLLEWANVSLGKEETYILYLSIRNLVKERNFKSVRFFGKVFGSQQNYYIIESELNEGSEDFEEDESNAKLDLDTQASNDANKDANEEGAPKPKQKPVQFVPKEKNTGVNKYVYWVCHQAGGEWKRLPDAQPKHIVAARTIRKALTGKLDRKIESYPAFEGTEAHYLRAQIARISASTVISPINYYTFDVEDGEEGEESQNIILNIDSEELPTEQLLDLNNWVHHTPYLLPQGRNTWINPDANNQPEANGDEEDEEQEAPSAEPETGPAILGPVSADEEIIPGSLPAWSVRQCSAYLPGKHSPVCLRSNRWPGAVTVIKGEKFFNFYVGNGLKELGRPYVPPTLPAVQKEWGLEEDSNLEIVTEKEDPTVEQEKEYEDSQKTEEQEGEPEEGEGDAEEGEANEEDDQ